MTRLLRIGRLLPLGCGILVGLQGCAADSGLPTQLSPASLRPAFTESTSGDLGGSKSTQGYWNVKPVYDWTVSKVLKSPTTTPISLPQGSFADLVYTISFSKSLKETIEISGVKGTVCVVNDAATAATGVTISDQVMISTDGGATYSNVGGPQVIVTNGSVPGLDTTCFPYDIRFAPTAGATYKNVATVSATGVAPFNVSEPFTMPAAAELFNVDNFADITDRVTCPTGFTCTPLTPLTGLQPWGWQWTGVGVDYTADLTVRVTNNDMRCGTFEVENLIDLQERNVDGTSPDYGAELRTARVVTQVFAGDCNPPPVAGCTPGFWKVKQHWVHWGPTGYSTTQEIGSVFVVPADYVTEEGDPLADQSLLEGLSFQGNSTLSGAAEILLRASVAALLNSAHPSGGYAYSTSQVISGVNAALASHDRATIISLAGRLDEANNSICRVKD